MTPAIRLDRLGIVMEPEKANPMEAWGVLNPGSLRLSDEELILYPRLVAEGNYSRIGIAKVNFDPQSGNPWGVERLGIALQPEADFERDERGFGGGVEDPRCTYIAPLDSFVMAYTAIGRHGPRVALAASNDGFEWRRVGLLEFPRGQHDIGSYMNKDAAFFPEMFVDEKGREVLCVLHRPTFLRHRSDGTVLRELPSGISESRPSIWISYIPLAGIDSTLRGLTSVAYSRLLACPMTHWESLKIGAGPPPFRTTMGWVLYFHGVSGTEGDANGDGKDVHYSAGVMVLDGSDPSRVVWRSPRPVLEPGEVYESKGIVNNVIFPTAVDIRDRRIDVYYGAADVRIGVAQGDMDAQILVHPSEKANE